MHFEANQRECAHPEHSSQKPASEEQIKTGLKIAVNFIFVVMFIDVNSSAYHHITNGCDVKYEDDNSLMNRC